MVEKRVDRSRRKVIRAVAKGVTAGLLLRISQIDASEKMTRQQAEYQDTPNGIYSRGMCTLFEAPASCKVDRWRGQQGRLVQSLRARGLSLEERVARMSAAICGVQRKRNMKIPDIAEAQAALR
jgi:hypothetical protein